MITSPSFSFANSPVVSFDDITEKFRTSAYLESIRVNSLALSFPTQMAANCTLSSFLIGIKSASFFTTVTEASANFCFNNIASGVCNRVNKLSGLMRECDAAISSYFSERIFVTVTPSWAAKALSFLIAFDIALIAASTLTELIRKPAPCLKASFSRSPFLNFEVYLSVAKIDCF